MEPDTKVHKLIALIRNQMDIDFFPQGYIGDLDFVLEKGNAAIAVDHPGSPKAEHIFG